MGREIHHAHEFKPYRKAHRAEKKADKANVKALNQEFEQQNGGFSSNPYSRRQQKRAIKREYAAAKAGRGTANTVKASEITKKAAEKSAEAGKKAGEFVAKHKKGFLIVGLIAAVFLLFTNLFSSCINEFANFFIHRISFTGYETVIDISLSHHQKRIGRN